MSGDRYRIRRTSSDSVFSIDRDKCVDRPFKRTFRPLIHDTNSTALDLGAVFSSEREACTKFRVCVTVNPYCTNVLFNPITEVYRVSGGQSGGYEYDIKGDDDDSSGRADMVRNTQYSSEKAEERYTYCPGADIFNNHILRNKSYRVVNRTAAKSKDFNTIRDLFRDREGNVVRFYSRTQEAFVRSDRHLYTKDDVASFETGEAMEMNLRDDDGWYGFYNTSTVEARSSDGKPLDINRADNGRGNCEFVDMYPGRELFSFAPYYNSLIDRYEYNWDIRIVYPCGEDYSLDVVKDGGVAIVEARCVSLAGGRIGVRFRSCMRHNLVAGSSVDIFYDGNVGRFEVYSVGDDRKENEEYYFTVIWDDFVKYVLKSKNINILDAFYGNLSPSNVERFIAAQDRRKYKVGDVVIKTEDNVSFFAKCTSASPNEEWMRLDEGIKAYRMVLKRDGDGNVLNDYEPLDIPIPSASDGYIKIIKESKRSDGTVSEAHLLYGLSYNLGSDDEEYIWDNDSDHSFDRIMSKIKGWLLSAGSESVAFRFARVGGGVRCSYYARKFKEVAYTNPAEAEDPHDCRKEVYGLGFAKTVYGDDVAQHLYTSVIDVEGLKDNKGCPVTDLSCMITKSNVGYEEWYKDGSPKVEDIEISHCFGPVVYGLDLFCTMYDSTSVRAVLDSLMAIDSVRDDASLGIVDLSGDEFYGDIVEFDYSEFKETKLCDVCHRFNTYQREHFADIINGADDGEYRFRKMSFEYDEIDSDDYDSGGFEVSRHVGTVGTAEYAAGDSPVPAYLDAEEKKAGYYYVPMYPFPVGAFGGVSRSYDRDVFARRAAPYVGGGMYVRVACYSDTKADPGGSVVFSKDVGGTPEFSKECRIVSVLDSRTVVVDVVGCETSWVSDWVSLCLGLNDGSIAMSVKNASVPEHAVACGVGQYAWRDVVKPWSVAGGRDYPFANGALYADILVRLFLKRQDRGMMRDASDIVPYFSDLEPAKVDVDVDNNIDYISTIC